MSLVHIERNLVETVWKLMFSPSTSCLNSGENNIRAHENDDVYLITQLLIRNRKYEVM